MNQRDLNRLLRPRSIAVVGGGAWCANVLRECEKIGFDGPIWPVHPIRAEIGGRTEFPSIAALPSPPDATFIGVNRAATVEVVGALAERGAGGAICFASGFAEAVAELADGADLQAGLVAAAGEMPILGPNCYGMINALDGAALWPDQHGCVAVERGVALVMQSSNVAINLTMQTRGLPLAYVLTVGNQAQTDVAELGSAALADPRVTALGLYLEGVGDLRRFEALAAEAHALGKSIVVLKAGASEQSRAAAVSHTAAMAGSAAGSRALFDRLGLAEVASLPDMLELLKLLHVTGPLPSSDIASMSCSGGEASLMADAALASGVRFPPLADHQKVALRQALGPKVALANPLDYHTYIWGDAEKITATFTAMMAETPLSMGCVVLDFPRADRCDTAEWDMVIACVAVTAEATGRPMALVASLAENMPERVAEAAMASGIVPFCGIDAAQRAIAAAARLGQFRAPVGPVLLPGAERPAELVSEGAAKAKLARFGLNIPDARAGVPRAEAGKIAAEIGFPVALKAEGLAHKTEAGGVALNLRDVEAVQNAALSMPTETVLIEEMVTGGQVELLVGVLRDPAHGFILTLAAGGTEAELLQDSTACLLPVDRPEIDAALARLRLAPKLDGYRGQRGIDRAALHRAVLAVQAFVTAHADAVSEVEINPLICTETRAVAADALIRMARADGLGDPH